MNRENIIRKIALVVAIIIASFALFFLMRKYPVLKPINQIVVVVLGVIALGSYIIQRKKNQQ
jgi:TctA family transporter